MITRDATVSLHWGVDENSNLCLFADFQRQHIGSTSSVSIILALSPILIQDINKQQEAPFGCYVRNGIVTLYMLW